MMEESGATERWCDGAVERTRMIAVLPWVMEESMEQGSNQAWCATHRACPRCRLDCQPDYQLDSLDLFTGVIFPTLTAQSCIVNNRTRVSVTQARVHGCRHGASCLVWLTVGEQLSCSPWQEVALGQERVVYIRVYLQCFSFVLRSGLEEDRVKDDTTQLFKAFSITLDSKIPMKINGVKSGCRIWSEVLKSGDTKNYPRDNFPLIPPCSLLRRQRGLSRKHWIQKWPKV